ncbi:MAG: sulfotransferase family protein [Thermodesulfobacteriota bacterium]
MKQVFIVGCYRSGTSLMRLILSSNPQIYVSQETNYIDRIWVRLPSYQDPSGGCDLVKLHRDVVAFLEGERWDPLPQFSELLEWVKTNGADYPSIVSFYATWGARREGREELVYWGDNTPRYVHCLSLLKSLFPCAMFIHMVRDPRDVVASALRLPLGGKTPLGIGYDWERAIVSGLSAEVKWGPNQVKRVTYESLVKEPTRTVEEICAFLGVKSSEKMFDFHETEAARHLSKLKHHTRVAEPIFTSSLGRYRKDLSRKTISAIEGYLCEPMRLLGYLEDEQYTRALERRLTQGWGSWRLLGWESVLRMLALVKNDIAVWLLSRKR